MSERFGQCRITAIICAKTRGAWRQPLLKRLFWILTVVALVGVSGAQDLYRRPGFLAGRTILTLSIFDEVQAELKTSKDQNAKLDALLDKLGPEVQDAIQASGGDFAEIFKAVEKINAKYDDECAKVLTADQNARVEQLFIQFNGAGAIVNPSISKDLAITDDQKTKIKAIQDDQRKKMMEQFQSGGPPDADTMKKLQDDQNAQLLKVLSDDQRTKFKTMEGAKFEFKKA
jgi:hypothetical protein